jgi:murein DD-endopeptidase MepM/ murein hydrolase activator NlpD
MLRRAFATGLTVAGLYALLLGPAGALAQDPTPTSSPDETATPTQTQTAEPTQTSEPTPESTSTSTPEATSSPEETPAGTPTASAEPVATIMATPTAQAETDVSTDAEALDYSRSVDVGEFVIDLDDPALNAIGDDESLPYCPSPARARALAKKAERDAKRKKSKKSKTSTSDRGLDCRPRKTHSETTDIRNPDGTPTLDNPGISLAEPGPAPIGVPNFMIDKFRIPPFLLPLYQAAGIQYNIRWEVLAAINEIETDYGRNLNVSSAGAVGWMQFMPATWKMYGVDANKDGLKDPFNPVDAIFAAARYLRAAGADTDLRKGIFAYNHADWYVDSVLMRARMIGGLPSNFVGSLTGLTQARFPVLAKARYAGDLDEKDAKRRAKKGTNAAFIVQGTGRRGIKIFARRGAPVVAVNDGKVVKIGKTKRLGHFVQLQDVYGNVFTYAHLATVAKTYPSPRPRKIGKREIAKLMAEPKRDKAPTAAASQLTKTEREANSAAKKAKTTKKAATKVRLAANASAEKASADPLGAEASKVRLYAHPTRPAARAAGGELQLAEASYKPTAGAPLKLNRRDYEAKKMRKGARVIAGTILGRIGKTSTKAAPHVLFEIRPAGRGAPRIDPKPILDGWKLLENTEIYRAAGKNPFFGPDAKTPSIGQILLMGKEALIERVLANPRIEIYGCGRRDVRLGSIDRRVLATLEFLAASGLKPTVTSLKCGHGFLTASGNVSEHSSGNAVDIAAVNGIPIIGHQGEGSITELAVQRLLTLQGTMKPHQIITLMTFEGADNTYAMADHNDHIHVGWQPMYGTNSKAAKEVNAVLKPKQWIKLIDRLGEIENPTVRRTPSKYALKVAKKRKGDPASDAHAGE